MKAWFGLGRAGRGRAELSLAAALRDIEHDRPQIRGVAIRNLAPALLDELGLRPPAWWARIDHPRRDEAAAALDRACADLAPQNAALARIGLAQLSAPQTRARAHEALATEGEDDAAMFMRECGVIALSMLGGAARAAQELGPELTPEQAAADGEARAEASALQEQILAELIDLLDDPRDDLRFQLGPALIEVGGDAVEPELLAALEREHHPEVRANLVSSIAQLDPPGPAACDALAQVLAGDEGKGWLGWEAALALTAARRPEGAPQLIAALRRRETRDEALEALAVLGEQAGPEAPAAVRRLSKGLLVPIFTKIRAAYALARMVPEEGQALLGRLAKHPRPAVREAVAEAREHLARLAAEGDMTDREAYRR
ncbi:MAG: HEAT repeat domain-containing protein [Enhygromyxa sp.]